MRSDLILYNSTLQNILPVNLCVLWLGLPKHVVMKTEN